MIKKLDKLLIKSYIAPFVVAFLVVLLLLTLQFLAKYIDDITGRGLSSWVLAKIFIYSLGTLVTLALPLGVLLASLSTMGGLGEHYELAAAKSSGISLVRLVRPLLVATMVITMASMYYSFFIMPTVNLKLFGLLYDVSKVKPTFALKPGHFYSDIDGYVIYVSEMDRERDLLYGIQIFDHTDRTGNLRVCMADSGKMIRNDSLDYLFLSLYHGVNHEAGEENNKKEEKFEYKRYYFDTLEYAIRLSGYDLKQSDESTFAPHQFMKTIFELSTAYDSIGSRVDTARKGYEQQAARLVHIPKKGQEIKIPPDELRKYAADSTVMGLFPASKELEILTRALNNSRQLNSIATIYKDRVKRETDRQRKFQIEWHYRIELPVSCLVFLFLGASLGAIVRKGGLGFPVVISVLFFIIFYVLMIQGRKFARDEIMPVWMGVWLPVLVMLPFAILFTYRAASERPLINPKIVGKVFAPFRRLGARLFRKKKES